METVVEITARFNNKNVYPENSQKFDHFHH